MYVAVLINFQQICLKSGWLRKEELLTFVLSEVQDSTNVLCCISIFKALVFGT